jgi:hypothetical protein
MSTTEKEVTRVTTGKIRLSYAKVWAPDAFEEGDDKKYSTAILIPKSDKVTIDKINAAVSYLENEVKQKNKGKLPKNFKLPLRDGDEEKPEDPNYADCYFLNASSKQKPAIVGLERDGNGKLKAITNEDEVYSGCYARLGINFYIFDKKSNGIAAGLNSIQKIADGDKLAGGGNAESDFAEDFEVDDDFAS